MSYTEWPGSIAPLDGGSAVIRRTDKNVHVGDDADKRVGAHRAVSLPVARARRARELLERSRLMTRLIDRALVCGALLPAMRVSLDAQSPELGDVAVSGAARALSRDGQPSA